jgi:uncharacterized repeat protein (TIGR01451 family)
LSGKKWFPESGPAGSIRDLGLVRIEQINFVFRESAMTFGKQFWQALGVVALGALVSTTAIGQVVTRLVNAGLATTTATIAPGGSVSIDVRLDVGTLPTPATGVVGTAFTLVQDGATSGFFSITARSFTGSPYGDPASGTSDAIVLAPASALLDPDNNDNLGRTAPPAFPTPVPPSANQLAVNLTLTASPTTPLGTYTIHPLAPNSTATDDAFNDYDMSGGIFTIIVAGAASPPTISKAFGAANIALNGTTSLTFTITNPNATALTGVAVTDSLPAGLVVSTPNGLTGSCGVGIITATAGNNVVMLGGGSIAASSNCTFTVNVTGTTSGVKNNVTSPVSSLEGGTCICSASATVTVAPGIAAPTITKSFAPTSIVVGGTSTLSFTITNPNPSAFTGVAVTDTLPAGVVVSTPNGLTGSCGAGTITATQATGSVSLTGGTIAASGSCTFSVSVTGNTAGSKVNTTGTVSSTEGGTGLTATATLTVAGIAAPTITKSFAPTSVAVGGASTLSFTITNPNAATAFTGVAVTDTLPAGVVVSTPNGLTGTCGAGTITATAGSGSVSLTGGTIAASGSCTFSVSVTGSTAGTKVNTTGTVSSTEGGTGLTATATLTVAAVAPPTISKVFGAGNIPANGTTTLSFTINNPNAATAVTGISFTDTFPAGLVVSTPNGLTGTCGAGTITAVAGSNTVSLTGGTLAANTSCTFTVNVTATALGNLVNTTGPVSSVEGGTGGTTTAVITVGILAPIPTLSQWTLLMLGLLMLAVTGVMLRSRRNG